MRRVAGRDRQDGLGDFQRAVVVGGVIVAWPCPRLELGLVEDIGIDTGVFVDRGGPRDLVYAFPLDGKSHAGDGGLVPGNGLPVIHLGGREGDNSHLPRQEVHRALDNGDVAVIGTHVFILAVSYYIREIIGHGCALHMSDARGARIRRGDDDCVARGKRVLILSGFVIVCRGAACRAVAHLIPLVLVDVAVVIVRAGGNGADGQRLAAGQYEKVALES